MAKIAHLTPTAQTPDRMIDSYLLRKLNRVRLLASARKGVATPEQVVTVFADFGRVMTPELLAAVTEMTPADRGGFLAASGETLFAAFGTHHAQSPMYRAFPNHEDVLIDKPMVDFLLSVGITRLEHTGPENFGANPVTGEQEDDLAPDADADAQFSVPLVWGRKAFGKVALGTDADVRRLALSSLSSLSPFTPDDAGFVAACVDEGFVTSEDLAAVRFREKMPALVGLVSEETYAAAAVSLTDALRLAAHFSRADVSLTRPVKFDLTKATAKRVLRLAEAVIASGKGEPEEDALRHEEAWKRLVRHAGGAVVRKAAPMLWVLVDEVRSGKVRSFESRVKHAFAEEAARMLAARPGAFVRGAVALSRRFDAELADRSVLLNAATRAFAKAPAPALLQLRAVLARTVTKTDRFHVMKNGKVVHSERKPETHDDLLMVLEDALYARLAGTLPWSGAKNAENRFVPIGGRSASQSSNGAVRGDAVVLDGPDAKVVRLFLHWKDASDVDLSAVFLDADGRRLGDCSFMSLRWSHGGNAPLAIHSGDIRDGRKGAAEYVDVDIKRAREAGVRTVLMAVNVYSGKPFAEFPTHAGVMLRDGKTGKHFEPSTVENAMRISSATTACTCAAFDLETMRLSYVDMPAGWGQRSTVRSEEGSLNKHTRFITEYGDYRVSMADVLAFAGTPGGPVLTDRELVEKRDEILSALAAVPAAQTPELREEDPDGPGM